MGNQPLATIVDLRYSAFGIWLFLLFRIVSIHLPECPSLRKVSALKQRLWYICLVPMFLSIILRKRESRLMALYDSFYNYFLPVGGYSYFLLFTIEPKVLVWGNIYFPIFCIKTDKIIPNVLSWYQLFQQKRLFWLKLWPEFEFFLYFTT